MQRLNITIGLLLLTLSPLVGATGATSFETEVAHYEAVQQERTFDSIIETVKTATITAQTAGQIIEINFDVDDFVEKDRVLLRLRDKEQRAALKVAEAKEQETESNFKRIQGLLEKKLISTSEYDRANADRKAAKAQLEQAQEQLAHTVVRAPYSGIVVSRHVEMGEVANRGTKLMTGISLEQLRAIATVPQSIINRVREMDRATVIIPSSTGAQPQVVAKRITITPQADPTTHSFKVRVDLPDGEYGLYPGMFVKVSFVVGEAQRLMIDQRAVVHRSEVTGLYVVDDQGGIHFRQVRIGKRHADGRIAIHSGVMVGERVVLDPIKAGSYLNQLRLERKQ